jgi:hypothetical protein
LLKCMRPQQRSREDKRSGQGYTIG